MDTYENNGVRADVLSIRHEDIPGQLTFSKKVLANAITSGRRGFTNKVKAFSDGRKKASVICLSSLADLLRQRISEGTVVCCVSQKYQLWIFYIIVQ